MPFVVHQFYGPDHEKPIANGKMGRYHCQPLAMGIRDIRMVELEYWASPPVLKNGSILIRDNEIVGKSFGRV